MDRPPPSPPHKFASSSPPRRSLNIPKQSVLPTAYTQHPDADTLDQIMLHYLDMKRY